MGMARGVSGVCIRTHLLGVGSFGQNPARFCLEQGRLEDCCNSTRSTHPLTVTTAAFAVALVVVIVVGWAMGDGEW